MVVEVDRAAPAQFGREHAGLGEIGKLALTVLIFSLVFTLVRPLSGAALFAGFIVTQLAAFSGFLMRSGQEQETDNSNGS